MDRYVQHRERLLTSSRPLPDFEAVGANGPWMHLADGRRVFDGSSGLLCVNVGQGSPAVFSRIEKQFSRYSFGGAAVVQPHIQMELMDRLCHAVGRPEDSVALTTCGTLGVEVAVGLARNIVRVRDGKRRGDILTSSLSYHGNSMFTLGVAGNQIRNPRPEDRYGLAPAFPAPYPPTHRHHGATLSGILRTGVTFLGATTAAGVSRVPVRVLLVGAVLGLEFVQAAGGKVQAAKRAWS
ncbi:aminotransferase class III-fold pyridoxal phosphate-dependent enzyme, partial [Streptomyces sp. NPDC051183]|uniref:aminotransferase class III-fold pyridoxal phosphate-dependent enzyme n=1 Tax=Streptomyces sp. NPDC051183 TaxID=3155165 RepID=UPI0034363CCE